MIICKHPKVAGYDRKSIRLQRTFFDHFVVEILRCIIFQLRSWLADYVNLFDKRIGHVSQPATQNTVNCTINHNFIS